MTLCPQSFLTHLAGWREYHPSICVLLIVQLSLSVQSVREYFITCLLCPSKWNRLIVFTVVVYGLCQVSLYIGTLHLFILCDMSVFYNSASRHTVHLTGENYHCRKYVATTTQCHCVSIQTVPDDSTCALPHTPLHASLIFLSFTAHTLAHHTHTHTHAHTHTHTHTQTHTTMHTYTHTDTHNHAHIHSVKCCIAIVCSHFCAFCRCQGSACFLFGAQCEHWSHPL